MAKKKEEKVVVEEVVETEVVEETAKVDPLSIAEEEVTEVVTEPEEPKEPVKKAPVKHAAEKKVVLTPKKYQHGKKYRAVESEIEKGKEYSVDEAITLIKKTATTKFDSSVEVHVNLNIDPSNADHQIRGSVLMPAGLGKNKVVCAIVNADKEKEAKAAGAEFVGGQDMIDKITKGWLDFDIVVATPDMMGSIGKVGKILGTKGLMPNPKTGTVTPDPAKVIAEIKKGRAEYKIDKAGSLHAAVGKVSFTDEQLKQNIEAFMDVITHSKPSSLKGSFITTVYLSSTMGPSVRITK
jgi:large subunit ribosomal protein L1